MKGEIENEYGYYLLNAPKPKVFIAMGVLLISLIITVTITIYSLLFLFVAIVPQPGEGAMITEAARLVLVPVSIPVWIVSVLITISFYKRFKQKYSFIKAQPKENLLKN